MKKQRNNEPSNDFASEKWDLENFKDIDQINLKSKQKLFLDKNSEIIIPGEIFHYKNLHKMLKQNGFIINDEEIKELTRDICKRIKDHRESTLIKQNILQEEILDSNEEYCIEHENDFITFEKILRKKHEYLYPYVVFSKCVKWRFNKKANFQFFSEHLQNKNKIYFCKINVGNYESVGNSKFDYKTARMNAIELFYSKHLTEIYDILFNIKKTTLIENQAANEERVARKNFRTDLMQSDNMIEDTSSSLQSEKKENPIINTSKIVTIEDFENLHNSDETIAEQHRYKNDSNAEFSFHSSYRSNNNIRGSDKKNKNRKEARIIINKTYESDYKSLLKGISEKKSNEKASNQNTESESEILNPNKVEECIQQEKAQEKRCQLESRNNENSSTEDLFHRIVKVNKNEDGENEKKKAIINSFSDLEEFNSIVNSDSSFFTFNNQRTTNENVPDADFNNDKSICSSNLNSKSVDNILVDLITSEADSMSEQEIQSKASRKKLIISTSSVFNSENSDSIKKEKKGSDKLSSGIFLKGSNDKTLKKRANKISKKLKTKSSNSSIVIEEKKNNNKLYVSSPENSQKNHKRKNARIESNKQNKVEIISEQDEESDSKGDKNENKDLILSRKNSSNPKFFITKQINKNSVDISINNSETSSTNFEKEIPSNFNSKEGIELVTKALINRSNKNLKNVSLKESKEEKPKKKKRIQAEKLKNSIVFSKIDDEETKFAKKEKSRSSTSLDKQINLKEIINSRVTNKATVINLHENDGQSLIKNNKSLLMAKTNSKSCNNISLVKPDEKLDMEKITSYIKQKTPENKSDEDVKSLLNKKRVREDDLKNSVVKTALTNSNNNSADNNNPKDPSEDFENETSEMDSAKKTKRLTKNCKKIEEIKKLISAKSKTNNTDFKKQNNQIKNKSSLLEINFNNVEDEKMKNSDSKNKYNFNQKNIVKTSKAGQENFVEINLSLCDSSQEEIIEKANDTKEKEKTGYDFTDFYKKSGLIVFKKNDMEIINYPYSLPFEKNYTPELLIKRYFDKKTQMKNRYEINFEVLQSKSSNKKIFIGAFKDKDLDKLIETEPMESLYKASQRIHQLLLSEIFHHQSYYWEIVEKIQLM